jgi:hypothetical protein
VSGRARIRLALLLALAAPPTRASGQELGARVLATDGSVAFHFAARPDVEVCDGSIRVGPDRTSFGRWRDDWDQTCVLGAVEVRVRVEQRRVRAVEIGPPGSAHADRDLGRVGAAEAAGWLLGLAASASPEAARAAVLPAAVADSVVIWPKLLDIARDRSADHAVREAALFWISRAAGEVVTRGLADVAADPSDDESVREAAVFALSRRSPDQAIPTLMDVARTAPGAGVRRAALFWLARSPDPRVLPFFEQILRGDARRP